MRGLLLKDFYLTRQLKKFIGIIIFVCFCMMFLAKDGEENISFVMGYICAMSGTFVINTVASDDGNKRMAFLMTLPMGRRTYIREKYLYAVIMNLIGWIGGSVLCGVRMAVMGQGDAFAEVLLILPSFFGVGILIPSILLPFMIKFGSEKGRMAVGIVFVAVFAAVSAFAKTKFGGQRFMKSLDGLFSQNTGVGIFLTGILILLLISYLISARIMDRKEF